MEKENNKDDAKYEETLEAFKEYVKRRLSSAKTIEEANEIRNLLHYEVDIVFEHASKK